MISPGRMHMCAGTSSLLAYLWVAACALAAAAFRAASSSGEGISAHPAPLRPASAFIAALCTQESGAWLILPVSNKNCHHHPRMGVDT